MTTKQIKVTTQQSIGLGRQGENNVVEVLFIQPEDLMAENWLLNHQRATDTEAYPCPLEKRGNALVWKVTSGDTAVPGIGNAELTCYCQNGEVLKSRIYNTCVLKSVTTGGKVPDPVKPWYDSLQEQIANAGAVKTVNGVGPDESGNVTVEAEIPEALGQQVSQNTQAIAQKLDADKLPGAVDAALLEAKESGQFDGAPGAQGPKGDTGAAGKDGVTPTIGDNGNWYIGTTDTGKPSRGETGATGPAGAKGDKGDTGPQGAAGAKGDKGDTGPTGAQGPKGDTGAQGPAGAAGKTPVKGTDYWTAEDKTEMVNDVLAALPTWTGGSY